MGVRPVEDRSKLLSDVCSMYHVVLELEDEEARVEGAITGDVRTTSEEQPGQSFSLLLVNNRFLELLSLSYLMRQLHECNLLRRTCCPTELGQQLCETATSF